MKLKLLFTFIFLFFLIQTISAATDTYTIKWVIPEEDTTPPTFDNLINHTQQANQSFTYDLDASDTQSAIDSFWLNDSTIYQIVRETGVITNATNLSTPSFWTINVSVNDTEGNIASDIFWINITNVPGIGECNEFVIFNKSTGTKVFGVTCEGNVSITGDILPEEDEKESFGSSILRWLKGFFVTVDIEKNVTINGSAGYTGTCTNLSIIGGIVVGCND